MRIKASLNFPSSKELMKEVGFDEGGKCQKFVDSFILYHSEPYTPGSHIHKSGVKSTKVGSGKVQWLGEDVEYLYEGKLMVDPITLKGAFFSPTYGYWSRPNTPKIMDPKGRNLNYHGNGKRGSQWYDRMIKEESDDLIRGVQNIVDGRK